jgi:hypothetical protein
MSIAQGEGGTNGGTYFSFTFGKLKSRELNEDP